MEVIPDKQVIARLKLENPWWQSPPELAPEAVAHRRRDYFKQLYPLIARSSVRRAVLLMGPRRVGKTVLVKQIIAELISDRIPPAEILYVSVEHPLYNGCSLERLIALSAAGRGADERSKPPRFVFFDEIQYLRDWEPHLKVLVDTYADTRFVASGSAAAALRLKSLESGAGRFTDFVLPPLTFHEYLLLGPDPELADRALQPGALREIDVDGLNAHFIEYLNFGGYPELALSAEMRKDPRRYVGSDIVDKVLLRDLPTFYGIQDVQELNRLFTSLAYNTGGELSLDELAKDSGVAKNTIKRYIEYLEAAFLIRVVHRIDRDGRRFQRATRFKVYLTNPSLRCALFAPVSADDDATGRVAETAVFAQYFHVGSLQLNYARWDTGAEGEVDLVSMTMPGKPNAAIEVKWTDRFVNAPTELRGLLRFAHTHQLRRVTATTRRASGRAAVNGIEVVFVPTSYFALVVGTQAVDYREKTLLPDLRL